MDVKRLTKGPVMHAYKHNQRPLTVGGEGICWRAGAAGKRSMGKKETYAILPTKNLN